MLPYLLKRVARVLLINGLLLAGAGSESGAAAPRPPADLPERQLTRLRRKDITRPAIITGHIDVQQAGQLFPSPGISVCIDGECPGQRPIPHTDAAGNYARELAAGRHRVAASFVGVVPSVVKALRLHMGDSVRLDFHLRLNTRPTTN